MWRKGLAVTAFVAMASLSFQGLAVHSAHASQPLSQSDFEGIAAGAAHALEISQSGTVWAWGDNTYGQLGDGTSVDRTSPVQIPNLTGVVDVAAGSRHSLALKSDGTVWAWGSNVFGQLGDGTTTSTDTPVRIQSLSEIVAISAGQYFSLALRSDGTVWAWGSNAFGQLGDGTTTSTDKPIQVQGLSGAVAVSAGATHSLAALSDGSIHSWGHNNYGQLGDGNTIDQHRPVTVTGAAIPAPPVGQTEQGEISAGYGHSLAATTNGLFSWGLNSSGQLGNGTTVNSSTPVQVLDKGYPVTAGNGQIVVSAGYDHSLSSDGEVFGYAWGDNTYGELGDGDNMSTDEAEGYIQAGYGGGAGLIAAGMNFSIDVTVPLTGDCTYTTGHNNDGQLGTGSTSNANIMALVAAVSASDGQPTG